MLVLQLKHAIRGVIANVELHGGALARFDLAELRPPWNIHGRRRCSRPRSAHGDGGVEGRAAAAQDGDAGLHSQRIGRRHYVAIGVLRLLEARPGMQLFAPAQAVAGMREISAARLAAVAPGVHTIALAYQDAPITMEQGSLVSKPCASRIPAGPRGNSRWRTSRSASRWMPRPPWCTWVTPTSDAHFARDDAYWRRRTHMAFPPYWFFTNDDGRQVLERRIAAARSICVHVPANAPSRADQRAPELRGYELFTVPGEVREVR